MLPELEKVLSAVAVALRENVAPNVTSPDALMELNDAVRAVDDVSRMVSALPGQAARENRHIRRGLQRIVRRMQMAGEPALATIATAARARLDEGPLAGTLDENVRLKAIVSKLFIDLRKTGGYRLRGAAPEAVRALRQLCTEANSLEAELYGPPWQSA